MIDKLSREDLERFITMQSLMFSRSRECESIKRLRKYYSGEIGAKISQREKEYINANYPITHNMIGLIVDTTTERLRLESISSTDLELSEFWDSLIKDGINKTQNDLYTSAYIDNLSFLSVDYIQDEDRFDVGHLKLYDGESGIIPIYRSDEGTEISAIVRMWTEDDSGSQVMRKTVYLSNAIYKYKLVGGVWQPSPDESDTEWPINWVDQQGEAIGIPIVPFFAGTVDKVASLTAMQDALNKLWVDLLAAADASGFPILVQEESQGGFIDSDNNLSGDDELRIGPGRLFTTTGKLKRVDAGDLSSIMSSIWAIVTAMAGVSKVPNYYLRHNTGDRSSDSLLQLEKSLSVFTSVLADRLSDGWLKMIKVSSNMRSVFGPSGFDTREIDLVWKNFETRNELHDAQIAHLHWTIGVPPELIIKRLGYNMDEITKLGGIVDRQKSDVSLGASGDVQ